MKTKETTTIEHPLESVFGIEPGTTEQQMIVHVADDPIPSDAYDDKDAEIDLQFQQIFNNALAAYECQMADANLINPKFRSRNQEVAALFLNTALNAAKEKLSLKQHKDKIQLSKQAATKPRTVNQNLIVADRNDILRNLLQGGRGTLED